MKYHERQPPLTRHVPADYITVAAFILRTLLERIIYDMLNAFYWLRSFFLR